MLKRSINLEKKSTRLKKDADRGGFPWVLILLAIGLCTVLFLLSALAVINAQQRDAEKKRGDLLQASVTSLRSRSDQDQNFFKLLKDFLTAQSNEEREALVNELRGLQFDGTPAASTTTTTSQSTISPPSSSVTPVTRSPSTTTTTRPSSTTTTTQASSPPPSSPPPTKPCTTVPLIGICSPAGN